MKKPVLLVVDDDRSTRDGLARAFARDYEVLLAERGDKALEVLREREVDVMLSDIRMPGMDGIALLQRALARSPQPVCILMTAYGSVDKAVEAMRVGAADYVTKPYNLDDLETRIEKALRIRETETENARLREQLDEKYGLGNMIGSSEPMRRVFEMIQQVAPTQATVLLEGESGTGKELVAHAIHGLSSRAQGPFVAVHCASLSQNLIESELFGHEKGSFTGANERRSGRFEMADGGTLFLDEVSEVEPVTQTKLLRVLEEHKFERVGGASTLEVDIRMVAATNKNLKQLVNAGDFREDLFFRLNVVNIELPPLRERIGDVGMLSRHFLEEFNEKNSKNIDCFSKETIELLSAYRWPGNVRELRNTVEKMVVLSRGKRLTPKDIPAEIRNAIGENSNRPELAMAVPGFAPTSMDAAEKMMILSALKQNNNNRTKAAEQLGISRRTLHRKLKQYEEESGEGSV